jgi:homoserine kinase
LINEPQKDTAQGVSHWDCDIPWHPDIVPVVAIPNFELSTKERGVFYQAITAVLMPFLILPI